MIGTHSNAATRPPQAFQTSIASWPPRIMPALCSRQRHLDTRLGHDGRLTERVRHTLDGAWRHIRLRRCVGGQRAVATTGGGLRRRGPLRIYDHHQSVAGHRWNRLARKPHSRLLGLVESRGAQPCAPTFAVMPVQSTLFAAIFSRQYLYYIICKKSNK